MPQQAVNFSTAGPDHTAPSVKEQCDLDLQCYPDKYFVDE